MKAQQFILIAIMLLTVSCGAAAQTELAPISPENSAAKAKQNVEIRQPPESVIKEIYAIHAADIKAQSADRIVNSESRRNLDKYFHKKLADLIWNDLTMERGEDDTYEIGVIDFDLFYATQEDASPVSNLRINPARILGDKATVRAEFTGGRLKETVEYSLIRENGAWKISDIKYRSGLSLLKRFEEAMR